MCEMAVGMAVYGYARVSTNGQSLETQKQQLRAAGCEKIFAETASGAKTNRAALKRAVTSLAVRDVLVVTRLDRLARSTRDLLNILAALAERGVGFRSLGDTWADTTTPHGRLMLTVLGGLAEFERELIRARTSEGRDRARARGVRLGRKPKLTLHQVKEARERRAAGETVMDIARSYKCPPLDYFASRRYFRALAGIVSALEVPRSWANFTGGIIRPADHAEWPKLAESGMAAFGTPQTEADIQVQAITGRYTRPSIR
jgi:DNA invertase Pin-like site-specific DNA recombinase